MLNPPLSSFTADVIGLLNWADIFLYRNEVTGKTFLVAPLTVNTTASFICPPKRNTTLLLFGGRESTFSTVLASSALCIKSLFE